MADERNTCGRSSSRNYISDENDRQRGLRDRVPAPAVPHILFLATRPSGQQGSKDHVPPPTIRYSWQHDRVVSDASSSVLADRSTVELTDKMKEHNLGGFKFFSRNKVVQDSTE